MLILNHDIVDIRKVILKIIINQNYFSYLLNNLKPKISLTPIDSTE